MPHNPLHKMHMPMTSLKSGSAFAAFDDIEGVVIKIVNIYFVGHPDSTEDWLLIDTGMPNSRNEILRAAVARFGGGARPKAILLTHGHFDHVGSAVELAEHWQVPVYAHELEMPYLTGEQRYPYPDDEVEGGMIAKMSRYFPNAPVDLCPHIKPLPEDGSVPHMSDWRWLHTPGHTPGHVSFFRDSDRALIVGDAFVTVRQDELYQVLTQNQQISGPPRYFTSDWEAARESVKRLAELQPSVALTGHGIPMAGEELASGLDTLARDFDEVARPAYGKSVD